MNRSQQGLWYRVLGLPLARVTVFSAALACGLPQSAVAASGIVIAHEIAARLTVEQATAYRTYLTNRADFERQQQIYWKLVEERREFRRHKYATRQPFVPADYVLEQPPKYTGPPLPPDIAAILASVAQAQPTPAEPEKQMPALPDFLGQALAVYNFTPERISEHEFKRRYAADALASGLSKDQVVRVYALETGGRGTYDLQAGIDPDTKQGRVISSAMGYAQLLSANSVNELVLHGDRFIARLDGLNTPSAHAKADVLRAMHKAARSVPNEWRIHQQFAQTPEGQGIHAINLDADVGPWLQVLKLKGLLETAAKEAGRTSLSGAELELMNLAGPRTGLEMMQPVGRTVPTANFFAEGGYYRNSIVRDKIGAQLLAAIDERMQAGLTKPGSLDFALAFDEVASGLPSRQARAQRDVPDPPFGVGLFGAGR